MGLIWEEQGGIAKPDRQDNGRKGREGEVSLSRSGQPGLFAKGSKLRRGLCFARRGAPVGFEISSTTDLIAQQQISAQSGLASSIRVLFGLQCQYFGLMQFAFLDAPSAGPL